MRKEKNKEQLPASAPAEQTNVNGQHSAGIVRNSALSENIIQWGFRTTKMKLKTVTRRFGINTRLLWISKFAWEFIISQILATSRYISGRREYYFDEEFLPETFEQLPCLGVIWSIERHGSLVWLEVQISVRGGWFSVHWCVDLIIGSGDRYVKYVEFAIFFYL